MGKNVICHHCGTVNDLGDVITRAAVCESCGRDLRCCLNCRFYDPAAHNQCREPQAELIAEKDRSNFCSYFSPAEKRLENSAGQGTAKARLEALFDRGGGGRKKIVEIKPPRSQKASGPKNAGEAKKQLEELFKKK